MISLQPACTRLGMLWPNAKWTCIYTLALLFQTKALVTLTHSFIHCWPHDISTLGHSHNDKTAINPRMLRRAAGDRTTDLQICGRPSPGCISTTTQQNSARLNQYWKRKSTRFDSAGAKVPCTCVCVCMEVIRITSIQYTGEISLWGAVFVCWCKCKRTW